jgi:stage V sporulation protein SpoVS
MSNAAFPPEIEVREQLDGVEFRLPVRADSEPRQMAGKLLAIVGVFDTVIVTGIVAGVGGPQMTRTALGVALGFVIASGLFMVFWGAWNLKARGAVEVGRDQIEGRTMWGPFGWRRRTSVAELSRLVIERDIIKHINIPGSREGKPEVVRLRAETVGGRRRLLVAGYHRRLVEPLAAELSKRLRVPVADLEPGASRTGIGAEKPMAPAAAGA